MIKKTLYFGNPIYLSLRNGQMLLRLPEVEKSDVLPGDFKRQAARSFPIEDLGVVILDHQQITITQGLLDALIENNCAIITCNKQRMPVGMMLPLSGNTIQSERFRKQLDASQPLKKQLWQQTMQYKIRNQATMLQSVMGKPAKNMLAWADSVRSGDPDNLEARAAVYYWRNLFPAIPNFVRSREGTAPNALLNYGYAILRAVVARALVSSGLLPTLGIHHHNKYNAYCLADDIMEPYRPYVDRCVVEIVASGTDGAEISKDSKAKLLSIPTLDVEICGQKSPLMVAVSHTTASLYKCFSGEVRKIVYPEM